MVYTKGNYEITFRSKSSGYIDYVKGFRRVITFIIYDNKTVAYDFPEQLPKYIKDYIEKLAKTL